MKNYPSLSLFIAAKKRRNFRFIRKNITLYPLALQNCTRISDREIRESKRTWLEWFTWEVIATIAKVIFVLMRRIDRGNRIRL